MGGTRSYGYGLALAVATMVAVACAADEDPNGNASGTSSTTASTDPTAGNTTEGPSGTGSATSAPGSSSGSSGVADASEGSDSSTGAGLPPGATPENLRIAFFGDHGLGSLSVETLQLVISEDAEALVILGDFDYDDDPTAWHEQLDVGLGTDFPVFAVAGNHDVDAWDGYREVIMDRRASIAQADCTGTIGEQEACTFQNLLLVLTAVGTMDPPGDQSHEDFIAEQLGSSESIWKVCGWHKNQNDMQVGEKGDEVGWDAYRRCMDFGAIIATGHEHSYSRTVNLTDLGNEEAGHGNLLGRDPAQLELAPGNTFVVVSGLGGTGIREYIEDQHDDDTWWATIYTSDYVMQYGDVVEGLPVVPGVFFVDFHVDGDPYKARAYFKSVLGDIVDEFEIQAEAP
jgi:predicted phosphodiesterase